MNLSEATATAAAAGVRLLIRQPTHRINPSVYFDLVNKNLQ